MTTALSVDTDLPEAARIGFELFRTPQSRETSAKETRILESASRIAIPHAQILDWPPTQRPEINLAGYVWDNDGPTVILTHGWELQAGRMGPFVAPLLQAGRRVVAFDAPAHGRSGGACSTLLDYEEAILNVIRTSEQLGHKPVQALMGHSFGGMAAAWMLARHRMPTVRQLVLIAAGTDVEFLMQTSPHFQQADDGLKQALREEFRRRVGRWPAEFDAAQAKTLIVHDRRDYMVPFAHAKAYARHISDAQVFATSGLGHRAILRDAKVIEAVTAFVVS